MDAEQKIWQRLRAGQLDGFKLRPQHPFPPYIVDFYCDAAELVVEVDGSQHTQERDRVRTRFMEAKSLTVLHFWSDQARSQTVAVIEAILKFVAHRTLTPNPLPAGDGL